MAKGTDPGNVWRDEQLTWQFDFLRASAERYETGHEYEALRLAATMRILCHDTRDSHSLLGQLGLKDVWSWTDSSRSDVSDHPTLWGPLVSEQLHGPEGVKGWRWAAPMGVPTRTVFTTFDHWWIDPIMRDQGTPASLFSRRQMILFVANQDGGAHVAPERKRIKRYNRFSREWSTKFPARAIDPDKIIRTPAWEFVRQVAFELQSTAFRADPQRFAEPTLRAELPPGYQISQIPGVRGGPSS